MFASQTSIMALILSVETSEQICSVALSNGTTLIGAAESKGEKSHATMLTVLIDELLKSKSVAFTELDAIAVSRGPGSYTGLRIGVSVAKGMCYALNIPLIAISPLQFIIQGAVTNPEYKKLAKKDAPFVICPMIDARRMEVYRQLFASDMRELSPVVAEVINKESFANILEQNTIVFIGSGADKCQETLVSPNAIIIPGIRPHAIQMPTLAHEYFENGQFEDVAYFEPFYLKDFVATTSKKQILSF